LGYISRCIYLKYLSALIAHRDLNSRIVFPTKSQVVPDDSGNSTQCNAGQFNQLNIKLYSKSWRQSEVWSKGLWSQGVDILLGENKWKYVRSHLTIMWEYIM